MNFRNRSSTVTSQRGRPSARTAFLRDDAPKPPSKEAEGMDEEDRPHPTEGTDNLKVADDSPATPSESEPSLPSPSEVTAGDREDEMVQALGEK